MDGGLRLLAGLYLLTGIVGFLPGIFLLLAAGGGLVFWALVLQTSSPPVSFATFAGAVPEAFPDFPFGTAGLVLLALHCLVAIANFPGGLTLLRKREIALPRARRLAALNLVVFPVGTALALLTYWLLSRPRPAAGPPDARGVGYLVGRLKGATEAMVGRGIDALNDVRILEIHRARLAGGAMAPKDVRPKVEGSAIPGGFVQRRGGSVDIPIAIAFAFFALMLVVLVAKLVSDLAGKGAASVNWFAAVPGILVFGGFLSFVLYLTGRRILAGLAHGGELAVNGWPLRPGGESRARLRVTTRAGAKVERIAARLRCVETVLFKDKDSKTQSTTMVVRDEPLPEVTPLPAADGSAGVEWILRMPRDAPTSFAGAGAHLSWQLMVDLRVAGAPDGTLSYDLLVQPGRAGT